MTALPPIGSLWQHRTTGERRFMRGVFLNDDEVWARFMQIYDGRDSRFDIAISEDWLAWQADADRIDKEQP